MSKFLKEAKRVKQVLSANTETISQVCGGVFVEKIYIYSFFKFLCTTSQRLHLIVSQGKRPKTKFDLETLVLPRKKLLQRGI